MHLMTSGYLHSSHSLGLSVLVFVLLVFVLVQMNTRMNLNPAGSIRTEQNICPLLKEMTRGGLRYQETSDEFTSARWPPVPAPRLHVDTEHGGSQPF